MQLALNDKLQSEMRRDHYDGATGVLTSGLVWLTASVVCFLAGTYQGVWTLLIGGALIYPLSTMLDRFWVKPRETSSPNALNQLAGASTIWLIACCIMAYGLYQLQEELFFPAMMITIGCRYTVFATIYGLKVYWVIGLTLIVASCVCFYLLLSPPLSALVGGLVELAFVPAFFASAKKFSATA